MTKVAKLTGIGLVTALGRGREINLQGLYQGQGLYRSRQLEGFEEAITIPYLAVDSRLAGTGTNTNRDAAGHMQWLLDSALEEALAGTELSAATRKSLPLFIGSSCYGIGLGEELYQQALATGDPAIPIPLDGFTQIGSHLRRRHGLMGEDYAFNTACTASANALLSAVNSINSGHHQQALVIGLETSNITTPAGFHGMQLLAGEKMRPFDKRRDGLVLGEGCAVLLLQAAAPESPGLTICGGASHCDTYSISASNPDGSSIAAIMQEALAQCNIQASDIAAIKAHGTASPLNDNGEAAGMRRLFNSLPPFFSLKSYIGHTLGGCGAIETALVAASLAQQKIPASAGFEETDEELGVAPLRQPQATGAGYYMLNFFGFGGNNCSLIAHAHQ